MLNALEVICVVVTLAEVAVMVFVSIMTLFALGLAASIILAVASRVFYVKEDPRVEAVVEALPGANCGGCGFLGSIFISPKYNAVILPTDCEGIRRS